MALSNLMKPLSRWFRPATPNAPAPPTVDARLAALDTASPQALIVATAGADETLAIAAIRKLPDGERLRALAGLGTQSTARPAAIERAAQERMAQLIDASEASFDRLLAASGSLIAALSVASLCRDPAVLAAAIDTVDPTYRATLAVSAPSSRIRQLAAQRIEEPVELRRLLKEVRGKDNGVYKILKQKCDALRAEEQRLAQIQIDIETLCGSLERHCRRTHDAAYLPTLQQLETQWRAIEEQAPPPVRERATRAIDASRELIAAELRRLAELAVEETRRESQCAAEAAARRERETLAAAEAHQRHETETQAAADAAVLREEHARVRAERVAAETHALQQAGGLIAKALGALRDGNTGRASGLRRALEEKWASLPPVPGHLANQLQQLDQKLDELKAWKEHAVAPKRAELIAEMEALVGADIPPRELADRIKQLQEDWKTISRGVVSDTEADWQRFHQAAQTAYLPCREYFEAQTQMRLKNVENRREVLERLLAFESAHGSDEPDWKAISIVLQEAPREWRRYSAVDRAANAAVEKEFDASLDRLQQGLDAWHTRNEAAKEALVQRAGRLTSLEDSRDATDAVKHLQVEWKEIGAARRDREQTLWLQFRERCDAVFQKRQQAHTDHVTGLEAHKARAISLCEEVEAGVASTGLTLLDVVAGIPAWREAWEAVGELPRADERKLRDRFERALKLCQAGLAEQRMRDQERAFTALFDAARLIQTYGAAVARGATSEERDALKQNAKAFVAGVDRWPKNGPQALAAAWAKAEAAIAADEGAHLRALTLLCIRSEILTDRPTPAEDQTLRRDYQMQRLMQRMGQQRDDSVDDLDALALEWIGAGPVAPTTYEALTTRFLACR